jgi:hypothetical protein
MRTSKWLCAMLAVVLVVGGPLASLASAQMKSEPSGPAPAPNDSPPYEPSEGAKVGAGFLNVVYVPGKAILCGAGTLTSTLLMVLTFGSAYRAAAGVFNEGCGGSWILTPYDVAGRSAPEERSY